jgi:hypothetical protein
MQTENNQRLNDLKRMKAKLGKKKEIEKQRNERIERQLLVADNAATESKDLNEVKIIFLFWAEIYGQNRKNGDSSLWCINSWRFF